MDEHSRGGISINLACGKCGRGIFLWCEGWIEQGQAQPMTFACPWPFCGANHRPDLPAESVSPTMRDDNMAADMIAATLIALI